LGRFCLVLWCRLPAACCREICDLEIGEVFDQFGLVCVRSLHRPFEVRAPRQNQAVSRSVEVDVVETAARQSVRQPCHEAERSVTPLEGRAGRNELPEKILHRVDIALADNPDIAAAHKSWNASLDRIPQSRSWDDPVLGVDTWRKGPQADGPSQNGLMASQTVPWFGKSELRGNIEAGAAKQAEMTWRMKALEVVSNVKRAYYDLWQSQRELDVNRRNQELMQQFVDVARARYETGKASQSDLIRAQQEALAELNALLRRDPATPVEIGPEVTAIVQEPAVTLQQLQEAAVTNPELLALQDGQLYSAEAALRLAKKGYEPDLQVRVEAWQYEGAGGLQEVDAGVAISFPWLNRGRHGAAVREAHENLEASRERLDAMRVQTAAEVKKLFDGVHTMHHHYELYTEKLIPQQQLAVEAARAAYETGTGGFLDVLDAQRMLFDLEMENLHHAAEFQRLLASLEREVGGQLPMEDKK